MPTYAYRCDACGNAAEVFQSIGAYMRTPEVPQCCAQPMARRLSPAAVMTTEADYSGMRTRDPRDPSKWVDISSRTKHRAFMREHGLTTADDFTQTWQRDAHERAKRLAGVDPTRKADIAQAIAQVQAKGDRQ